MAEDKKTLSLVKTELKQKQNVLNLDTNDDSEIIVITNKYSVPAGMSTVNALAEIQKVFGSPDAVLAALLKGAESASYQDSKNAALAKGNFLSSGLKSTIVGFMQNLPTFADVSAKDCFARWLAGYKDKKKSAVTLLERAKATEEFSDL